MDTPMVSVVMPVWNRADRVGAAIQSVLAQTYENFEFILVDDGSSDGTLEVVRDFDSPKLEVIALPANCGVATAREVGRCRARGTYLAQMDSDDISLPQRLERQVQFMERHPEIALSGTRAVKVLPSGEEGPMHYPDLDPQIKAMILNVDGAVISPSTIIRASFLREHHIRYEASFITDEDSALFFEIMRAGGRFHNIDETLLRYVRHGGNTTTIVKDREARKTSLRERVLSCFFPGLDHIEVRALAALMERGRQRTFQDVCHGIAAAGKAVRDRQSYFGEDKALIRRLIDASARSAQQAVIRTIRGPANPERR